MSSPLPEDTVAYYAAGREQTRLERPAGYLEWLRTQDIIRRFAPPPPAVALDVGGGSGPYAYWLAERGYRVHLVDAMPLHVEQAREAGARHAAQLASMSVGDARRLDSADASADLVLLLGPLYHLLDRDDRLRAWGEARRTLRPGGVVFGAAISRFASTVDGFTRGFFDDDAYLDIARDDLASGRHRNPARHPGYFASAYFHRPEELREEARTAGLEPVALLAVEGPAWLAPVTLDRLRDEALHTRYLEMIRLLEAEPALLGVSAHLIAVARKPRDDGGEWPPAPPNAPTT